MSRTLSGKKIVMSNIKPDKRQLIRSYYRSDQVNKQRYHLIVSQDREVLSVFADVGYCFIGTYQHLYTKQR